MVTEDSSAVADLRSRWHSLCDVDRVLAVQDIHQAGMSLRKLAEELNCSGSLLSRLLQAAKASPEDLARGRRGELSTRELARRGATSGNRAITRHNEAIAFELERAAAQGRQMILSWLDEEEIAVSDREQIVELAHIHLAKTFHAAGNEQEQILQNLFFDEADRQARLGQTLNDRYHSIPWSALRLALWSVRQIPDRQVQIRAFELVQIELTIL